MPRHRKGQGPPCPASGALRGLAAKTARPPDLSSPGGAAGGPERACPVGAAALMPWPPEAIDRTSPPRSFDRAAGSGRSDEWPAGGEDLPPVLRSAKRS